MMNFLKIIIGEIGVIQRAIRRKYYIHFKPEYVKKQLRERKGICAQHGCCDLFILHRIYNLYFNKCLGKKSSRKVCLKWKNLPWECRVYPLDEKDKIPETKSYCHFHW